MSSLTELTPQERLAISRRAIIRQMNRYHPAAEDDHYFDPDEAPLPNSASPGAGIVVKRAIRSWWRHQPASIVADLAQPLLADYAKVHPFKLLSMSAGVGAAIILIRPWRMISVGFLLNTLKSSGLSNLLLAGLAPPPAD